MEWFSCCYQRCRWLRSSGTMPCPPRQIHCPIGCWYRHWKWSWMCLVPVQNSFLLFVCSMLFPANLHESLIVLPLDWNIWYVSRSSRNRFNLHGRKSASLGTNILLLGVLCTLISVTSSFHTHSSYNPHFWGSFLLFLMALDWGICLLTLSYELHHHQQKQCDVVSDPCFL